MLKSIIATAIILSVTCDGGIIIIFHLIKEVLNGNAWRLVIIGYLLSFINNLILINLILFSHIETKIYSIGIIIYFIIYGMKHIIWLFGYLNLYKNLKSLGA